MGLTKSIDYEKIIDEMSPQGFKYLIGELYPICEYNIVTIDDIRPIDIKEQLLRFSRYVPNDSKGNPYGTLENYISVLKEYFDVFLKCKDKSRASRYKKRALELMDAVFTEEGTIEDVEDVVSIFISLFRVYSDNCDKMEDFLLVSNDFDVYMSDFELIKSIREREDFEPCYYRANKKKESNNSKSTFQTFVDILTSSSNEEHWYSEKQKKEVQELRNIKKQLEIKNMADAVQKKKDLFYVNNILFSCRIMDKKGTFKTMEKTNG